MKRFVEGLDRRQTMLFPALLDDYVSEDNPPLIQIDDGRLLNQLPVWAPDAALRKTILVDNPARLYGFG